MLAPARIAVLTHKRDNFESRHYFLSLLIACWKAAGIEVVVLKGTEQYVPADILILHVDLTIIPNEYVMFAQRYPIVLNGSVLDISKRRISSNILDPEDPYNGPVIVKTDLNSGGIPEILLEKPGLWKRLNRKIWKKLPWTLTGYIHRCAYPIYPNSHSVPHLAWRNPRLVVEKLLTEREGDFYCVRHWLFIGNKDFSYRAFSSEPIVKAGNTVHRERGIPIPETLRALRSSLGFDYGKFDFADIDGEVVLYDVNRTPTMSPNAIAKGSAIAEDLKDGLYSFVDSSMVSI